MTAAVDQAEIVATIRDWVDREVSPVASELEHADEFPAELVAQMRALGLFGVTVPEEFGGLGLGLDTYALIVVELSRGWATLPGIVNGSFIASYLLRHHGTGSSLHENGSVNARVRYHTAAGARTTQTPNASRSRGWPGDMFATCGRNRRYHHGADSNDQSERLVAEDDDQAPVVPVDHPVEPARA